MDRPIVAEPVEWGMEPAAVAVRQWRDWKTKSRNSARRLATPKIKSAT